MSSAKTAVVEVKGCFMQKTVVAGKRDGIAGADADSKPGKFLDIVLLGPQMWEGGLVALDTIRDGLGARMTT